MLNPVQRLYAGAKRAFIRSVVRFGLRRMRRILDSTFTQHDLRRRFLASCLNDVESRHAGRTLVIMARDLCGELSAEDDAFLLEVADLCADSATN